MNVAVGMPKSWAANIGATAWVILWFVQKTKSGFSDLSVSKLSK